MRIAYAASLITAREREDARETLVDRTLSALQAAPRTANWLEPLLQEVALLDRLYNTKLADSIELHTLQQQRNGGLVKATRWSAHNDALPSSVQ